MIEYHKFKKFFFSNLLNTSSRKRKLVLLLVDIFIIPLSFYLTYWLKLSSQIFANTSQLYWVPILIIFFSIPLYLISGQYKSITRYFTSQVVYFICLRNLILLFVVSLTGFLLNFQQPKINTWILIWLLLTSLSSGVRLLIRDIIASLNKKNDFSKKIAIYGAGKTGALLAKNLKLNNFKLKFFIDDDPDLWGRSLDGINIHPTSYLSKKNTDIDQVLIAIPNLKRKKLKEFINWISDLNLKAYQVPSVEEIAKGKTIINRLKPISVEELLGRDIVPPDLDLIKSSISNKNILITGGGGSIGSELFIQIMGHNPNKVIVVDNSENNLYNLQLRVNKLKNQEKCKLILCSACDQKSIEKIFLNYKFDLVFHAAAYKHVPIVEDNKISGLKNNIFSSKLIADISIKNQVKNVVLISTDKAVRPTNLMGLSKRVSELIFKSSNLSIKNLKTVFSMVRFGNVLESSGSVVPLFKEQIKNGGPITLTHRDITRYFMTIKEAVQLVLQSPPLSRGGDIFLLEMGEAVKIEELAKQMIILSGLKIKDENNPNGDIEIKTTGLRPGEKLHEELLVNNSSEPTEHPLIYRSNELKINTQFFEDNLSKLLEAIENDNIESTLIYLRNLVPEFSQVAK